MSAVKHTIFDKGKNAIPSRYAILEWIDTGPINNNNLDAGAVIDTGIKVDRYCEIECEILTFGGSDAVHYGAYYGSSDGGVNSDVNCVVLGTVYNKPNNIYMTLFMSDGAKTYSVRGGVFHKVLQTYDGIYVDGAFLGSSGESNRHDSSNFSLTIGCRNSAGAHWRCSRAKYKYFIIRRQGKLLCDLVPVLRVSDSLVGMYDRVSGKFLTSINTRPLMGPQI